MEYRSRVYTDRPAYADYEPAEKFEAIIGIIMTRLRQHPVLPDLCREFFQEARRFVAVATPKYLLCCR